MKSQEHPLSWHAIARVVIAAFIVYLVWNLTNILLIVVLSLMLASALYPLVRFFNKKLSLPVASVFVILLLFLPIVAIVLSIIPSFIDQYPALVATLNNSLKRADVLPSSIRGIDITQYAESGVSYLFNSTSKITSGLTTFFTTIFLTLYILIDAKRLKEIVLDMIPDNEEKAVEELINGVSVINGLYIRGNLLISLICGTFITIGLLLLDVPFAIPLGVFAGLLDLLPLVGALIGAIPAVILGFAISPTIGLLVILLFFIYQQIENNILAPNIYNRALDLSPALSFLAVIIGTALFGVIGAFIALPIAASVPTFVKYISTRRRLR